MRGARPRLKRGFRKYLWPLAAFLFLMVVVQLSLPSLMVQKSEYRRGHQNLAPVNLSFIKELAELDYDETMTFEPSSLLKKFNKDDEVIIETSGFNRTLQRFGNRQPRLAFVFADMLLDSQQLLMMGVGAAMQHLGYSIQVYSLEDGPERKFWEGTFVPVEIIQINTKMEEAVDWLSFDGILVTSLEASRTFSLFMQEPFNSVPLIWTIHGNQLSIRSREEYTADGHIELINNWKKVFARATVVVFPDHLLSMAYSAFDSGNYYVIPDIPLEAWKKDDMMELYDKDSPLTLGYQPANVIICIVGSQYLYRGILLDHSLVLRALLPLLSVDPEDSSSSSRLDVFVFSGDSKSKYNLAIESIASDLGYPEGVVEHLFLDDEDLDGVLGIADVVIYGTFLEEQYFPTSLKKALCMGKPIVAPGLTMIREYVDDRENGYLFPKKNIKVLTQIVLQLISKRSPPLLASKAKDKVRWLGFQENIQGYALLLENVLKLPSEVASPLSVDEIAENVLRDLSSYTFSPSLNSTFEERNLKIYNFLNNVEERWNRTRKDLFGTGDGRDESFSLDIWEDDIWEDDIWEEEKAKAMLNFKRIREEEELKDRTDEPRGVYDAIFQLSRKIVHSRNDLRVRNEWQLLRSGQPLCIYEPFFGEGTRSFLHVTPPYLYRGIGLTKGDTRPGTDDIDAASHLSILKKPYYRDILGEYGALFAIANRTDRIHKNPWIGFQSWRATARKASLSRRAEAALLDAIQAQRHGDALYFWVRMDMDPRNEIKQDFWSFCDTLNAGNCKFAFSEAIKSMYGIESSLEYLPPMPEDGDTWSVMMSWALPTRSFLEFVMFSRMFVDALDAQMSDKHSRSGHCYLSLWEDKHCYSRLLELLVNVWAYHSARQMVYVDPDTGSMQEHHKTDNRRGKMWVKWFDYSTLKGMDEQLAEQADSEQTEGWLWPSTGEVVYQGIIEKERERRQQEKEERRRRRKDTQLSRG